MRCRVLYVCFDAIPSPKGASTHVTYFTSALAERHDVTLMSLGHPARTADPCYQGARHVTVPLEQPNLLDRALAFREAVWDELERERYEVVHFRTMWAALPVAEERKRQGFRAVCEVNGVESIELKYHYPRLRADYALLGKLRAQERLASDAADAIVTPSEVTKRWIMRQGVPGERVRVIPNGVDLGLFRPQEGIAPRAAGDWTVLYVGTLQPWQGLDFLLEALRRAIAYRPMRLRILGTGVRQWGRELQRTVRKRGMEACVEFLPAVPHERVAAAINAADVCVAPLAPTERNLIQGCCPVKILEYMACGKPIIASDLPVVREILTHDEDALLFRPRKPARLADELLRLADDSALQGRLGANALRNARERFSWRRAQDALLEVYEGLAPTSEV